MIRFESISLFDILGKYGIKVRVKWYGLDAKILNEKEILALNNKIKPYRIGINGGYIWLEDEYGNVIDDADFND